MHKLEPRILESPAQELALRDKRRQARRQARVMRITVARWYHAVSDSMAMREAEARLAKRAGAGLEASVVMEWRRRTRVSDA